MVLFQELKLEGIGEIAEHCVSSLHFNQKEVNKDAYEMSVWEDGRVAVKLTY